MNSEVDEDYSSLLCEDSDMWIETLRAIIACSLCYVANS